MNVRLEQPDDIEKIRRINLEAFETDAEANLVETTLVWMDQGFVLTIKDDGRGFEPQGVDDNNHYGLIFMGERIDELGGDLLVDTEPGKGTMISISIPFAPVDESTAVSSLT